MDGEAFNNTGIELTQAAEVSIYNYYFLCYKGVYHMVRPKSVRTTYVWRPILTPLNNVHPSVYLPKGLVSTVMYSFAHIHDLS